QTLRCRGVGPNGTAEVTGGDLVIVERSRPVHERTRCLGVRAAGDDAHGVEAKTSTFTWIDGRDGPAFTYKLGYVGFARDAHFDLTTRYVLEPQLGGADEGRVLDDLFDKVPTVELEHLRQLRVGRARERGVGHDDLALES